MFLQRRRRFSQAAAHTVSSGGGGGWTPASLGAALIGWWKADAGTNTTTNGGTLTSWNDQSGNSNNFAFNNVSSTYDTTHAKNGLPVINNTGTSCGCKTASTFTIGGAGGALSCFVVLQIPATTPAGARVWAINQSGTDNGTTGGVLLLHPDQTSLLMQQNGSKSAASAVLTGGNWAQIGGIFDGANSICYFGNGSTGYTAGTTVAATGTFTSPATDFRVGMSGTGGNNVQALYGEVVCTNTAMSGTDRSNLYTYFQTRWAVS